MQSLLHKLLLLAEEELPLKEQLIYMISEYSYLGVFLFLIACGLGFPAPEEIALIGGGYAVYTNDPNSWPKVLLMVAVAMTGVLVGDVLLYLIGRRVGETPEKVPIIGRHLTPARMRKARAMFAKHDAKAVFFGRFLFGIRAVTFFVSGSMRVPLLTFVVMDGLAALLTVPISVILAWHFGGELQQAFDYIRTLDSVVLALVAGTGGAAVVYFLRKRRLKEEAAAAEADAIEDAAKVAQQVAQTEVPHGDIARAQPREAPARPEEPAAVPEGVVEGSGHDPGEATEAVVE